MGSAGGDAKPHDAFLVSYDGMSLLTVILGKNEHMGSLDFFGWVRDGGGPQP